MKLRFDSAHNAIMAWISRLQNYQNTPHHSLSVYSTNRRVWADGFTVYSYGTHFPMVRWLPEHKTFLLNITRWSNTTTNHQQEAGGIVNSWAPHFPATVFRLDHKCMTSWPCPAEALAYYDDMIRTALAKGKRARLQCRKQWQRESAERWLVERNHFALVFKLQAPELPGDVTAALVTLKLAA